MFKFIELSFFLEKIEYLQNLLQRTDENSAHVSNLITKKAEFKSKDACADAPRMNDRNLRRPYNFRTPKKYAYHHETSKTAALELEINCD